MRRRVDDDGVRCKGLTFSCLRQVKAREKKVQSDSLTFSFSLNQKKKMMLTKHLCPLLKSVLVRFASSVTRFRSHSLPHTRRWLESSFSLFRSRDRGEGLREGKDATFGTSRDPDPADRSESRRRRIRRSADETEKNPIPCTLFLLP